MNYSYENFDWEKYILENNDLQIGLIMNLKDAWNHWINNGQKENRKFYFKTNNKDNKINDCIDNIIDRFLDFLDTKKEEKKEDFDWVLYLLSNPDLIFSGIKSEKDAVNHWLKNGIKENRKYFLENYNSMLREEYLYFDWEIYKDIHSDLKNISCPELSWNHWLYHGIKEERAIKFLNNSKIHNARFGNLFFINMTIHFLCIKYNLKFNYKYYNKFKKLGIDLFIGSETFNEILILNDNNFLNLICEENFIKKNIIVPNDMWCQTKNFCEILQYYFGRAKIKLNIIKNNIFRERYNKNNDLFIHLRLGDVELRTTNIIQYYENIINSIPFDKGYISSDDINHPLFQNLKNNYNLTILNLDEEETIMFGSTCKNIILSGGTFSWLIGFFAFFSKNIYYPNIQNKWYGDIFIFPNWKMI